MRKTLLAILLIVAVAALALPVFARGGPGCRSGGCGPGWRSAKADAPESRFSCGGPCGQSEMRKSERADTLSPGRGPAECRPDCPNVPGQGSPENPSK